MPHLEVFDPPMCCSTGVCGPSIDPKLVHFAAELESLAEAGVAVTRHNLAQEPQAFVGNSVVLNALNADDVSCLPFVLLDGQLVASKKYPSREELASLLNLSLERI